MKTELTRDLDEAKSVEGHANATKICMHVLTTFRTDARVIRSATALKDEGFDVSVVDIVDTCSQSVEEIHGISVKHLKTSSAFMAARFRRWALIKALLVFIRSTLLLLRTPA